MEFEDCCGFEEEELLLEVEGAILRAPDVPCALCLGLSLVPLSGNRYGPIVSTSVSNSDDCCRNVIFCAFYLFERTNRLRLAKFGYL